MTIAVAIRINNGLVLATDSSSTIIDVEDDVSRVYQTYFNVISFLI